MPSFSFATPPSRVEVKITSLKLFDIHAMPKSEDFELSALTRVTSYFEGYSSHSLIFAMSAAARCPRGSSGTSSE